MGGGGLCSTAEDYLRFVRMLLHRGKGVYISQILPFADVKSLPLFYAFEKSVYQALG